MVKIINEVVTKNEKMNVESVIKYLKQVKFILYMKKKINEVVIISFLKKGRRSKKFFKIR